MTEAARRTSWRLPADQVVGPGTHHPFERLGDTYTCLLGQVPAAGTTHQRPGVDHGEQPLLEEQREPAFRARPHGLDDGGDGPVTHQRLWPVPVRPSGRPPPRCVHLGAKGAALRDASIADTPGSGRGRRVTRTSRGASRTKTGETLLSAAARSGRPSASPPRPAPLARPGRGGPRPGVRRRRSDAAARAASCRLRRPRQTGPSCGRARDRSLVPMSTTVALSRAGPTTVPGWSGATPAQPAIRLR